MFAYPFRPAVIGWVVGLSLASLAVHFLSGVFLLGWLLAAGWWVMAFKLASDGLLDGAYGRADDQSSERNSEDSQAVRHVVLWILLALFGWLAWAFGDAGGLVFFCIAVTPIMPAAVVLVAMEDSLLRAFNPRCWLELIQRIGPEYLLLAAKLAGVVIALALVLRMLLPPLPDWIEVPLSRFVVLTALFAGYHELGVLLHRYRRSLMLADESAIVRPVLATREEDLAMHEASLLAGEEKLALASARLDPLIRGQGASPPVHARYRELLTLAGDRDGLLRHARDYIAVLLTLGKSREAMALYLSSRADDPTFELEEAQKLSDLIALAARNQQSQLAVALAEEFSRRFPRDRDLVLNGLTAARLMDRLGREADARLLIRDLLRRFPEHPLHDELQATLQGLEQTAR